MSESVIMSKEKWIELRQAVQTKDNNNVMQPLRVDEVITLINNLSLPELSYGASSSQILSPYTAYNDQGEIMIGNIKTYALAEQYIVGPTSSMRGVPVFVGYYPTVSTIYGPTALNSEVTDLVSSTEEQIYSAATDTVYTQVTLAAQPNLIPSNIKAGITICGVTGTLIDSDVTSITSSILDGSISGELTTEMLGEPVRFKSYSFCNRQGLTRIEVPNTVKRLGDYCFYGCTNLSQIIIDINNSELAGLYDDIAQTNLEALGVNTFQNCTALSSISLPATVTKIPAYCFRDCINLIELQFNGADINTLGQEAFYRVGCNQNSAQQTHLSAFIATMQVESVPRHAFAGLNLTALSISPYVKDIAYGAFGANSNLFYVTFQGTPTSIDMAAFLGCPNLKTINVPWAEGAVANAPWGANATINYNYGG